MSSGWPIRRAAGGALVGLALALATPAGADARDLRVCADPNNLPFSNDAGEGFENKLVAIVAEELNADVSYAWHAQRRGFIRETLRAGLCDLVPGTPANLEMLRTTAPYYRSGYVFVTRAADGPRVSSLDDPELRHLRIGVQLIGDDGANAPPAHALARRGLAKNLRGYPVYGNYASAAPGRAIIDALGRREIDIAVVWGPTAGYFARHNQIPLELRPVRPQIDGPWLPMIFDISMGVRKEDVGLRREVDEALARRRRDIDAVLAEYGVPRFDPREGP
jgi:mxaJ protein